MEEDEEGGEIVITFNPIEEYVIHFDKTRPETTAIASLRQAGEKVFVEFYDGVVAAVEAAVTGRLTTRNMALREILEQRHMRLIRLDAAYRHIGTAISDEDAEYILGLLE